MRSFRQGGCIPVHRIEFAGILLLAIGLCLMPVAAAATENETGAVRPNILLIVAEDMSSRVGAFGDLLAQTPAIDALAAQGVRFTGAFAASGVCAPNRSALITGVYPQSMGTQQMRTVNMNYLAVPPPQVKAFPELLRAAGYATANTVKTDYQFGEPFTIWDANIGNYGTAEDLALWRRLPDGQPWFAMINLMNSHESRLVSESTAGKGRWKNFVAGVRSFRADNIRQVTDAADVVVPPYYPDTPEVRASIAQHYDNIHFIDSQVGQTLANLQVDGLADDTVVIFTTDHGDGLPRAKRSVYDSGLSVPLVVRYPDGRGSGEVERRLVSFVDLAPSILRLAGVLVPAFIQGRDFLGADAIPRDYVFAGRDRMDLVPDRVRAVRDQRFKYLRNYMQDLPYFRPLTFRDMFPVMQVLWEGHEQGTLNAVQNAYFVAPRPAEELYDTVADPFEVHNLAADADYAEVLQRMRGALSGWMARVGDLSSEPEQQMIERMWPGGKQPQTGVPYGEWLAGGDRQVVLRSRTQGASIGYRIVTDRSDSERWALYTGPVSLPEGVALQAKAIRYGFAESAVANLTEQAIH